MPIDLDIHRVTVATGTMICLEHGNVVMLTEQIGRT
jgi:hypothetical protein